MATRSELLLAFYGDDFTGSTDAMEALALSGLRTVLFLSPPTPDFLQRKFPDLRCMGVAGTSRAMSPAEMDAQLEPVLRELWALGAPLTHYKVCSTFDSAPEVGSIGHVADMARGTLTPGQTISVLAGAPPLRRYTVFGNHFAAAGDEIFRLDRHPTMSRHPVTPMHEADLRVHLSHQTRAGIGLMSLPELAGDDAGVDARHALKLESKPDLLLYDCADDQSLRTVGRLIWQQAQRAQHFAIGSSGVEYALSAHWRASGVIPAARATFPAVSPVKQLLVVSGSASPMTASQIQWASEHGFDCIRAPTEDLCRPRDGRGTRPGACSNVRSRRFLPARAWWSTPQPGRTIPASGLPAKVCPRIRAAARGTPRSCWAARSVDSHASCWRAPACGVWWWQVETLRAMRRRSWGCTGWRCSPS